MEIENDLASTLQSSVMPVTIKQLRKHKVKSVQVIERSRFLEALSQLAGSEDKKDSPNQRRIERLLQEVEKLGREKKDLEHNRGLAEAERSRLQADLDGIATELGRNTGKKTSPEDVKELLKKHNKLREETRKTRKPPERMQAQAQQRLDQALSRSNSLKQNLDKSTSESQALRSERDLLQIERDEIKGDRERFRRELEQFKLERDRFREERDRFRMERDRSREERDQVRVERDSFLQDCAKVGQERDALREKLDELAAARRLIVQLEDAQEALGEKNLDLELEIKRMSGEIEELKAELEDTEAQLGLALAELEEHTAEPEPEPESEKPAAVEKLIEPSGSRQRLTSYEFGFGRKTRRTQGS